jgi:hypothetical protein
LTADGGDSGTARPGWARERGEVPPCPLWTSNLLGLRAARFGILCTLVVVAGVVASRFAVVPASIWDRDEAHLGLAVARFDPSQGRPHPPWFPLWVVAGKLVRPLVAEPARGLQILSASAGAWSLFPLTALLSIWMRRRLAAAAAVLYLTLPGPWYLSARAYSDTTATALLLLAAAWWLRPQPDRRDLLGGSVAAAACLLVRPQLVLPVVGLACWFWLGARERRDRLLVVLPLALAALAAVLGLLIASGSAVEPLEALSIHLRYHTGGLADADRGFVMSGIARALIHPVLGVGWVLVGLGGLMAWQRSRHAVGAPWPLLTGGLGPVLVSAVLLSDPTQARYALPVLALSAGPVAIGLWTLLRRWSIAVVGAMVAVALIVGLPQSAAVRSGPSPVMAALDRAGREALEGGGVVVVDRTLRVFADYATEAGQLTVPVVTDFSVEIGAASQPPARTTAAVYDRGRGGFVVDGRSSETFSCSSPWLRRIGPDRFLDVTVVTGARVGRVPTRW